jgi:uncharacterized protein (TIGR02271 family)
MATQTSPITGRPIVDWFDEPYTLRDVDADKIGDIVEVNPDFIVAETDGGFLGLGEHRRYFVPRNYIQNSEGNDWYLSIDKDQIENMNWSNAPTQSTWGTEEWQQRYASGWASEDTPRRGEGRMRMLRYEEELQPQKVQRQAGEVTVTKNVVEETKTIEVPVRREEVHVERRPVTDATAADPGQAAFSQEGQTLRVPVMEEDVQVTKTVRPVEEVEVTKTGREETRQVSDTVRREEFDVHGADQVKTKTPR